MSNTTSAEKERFLDEVRRGGGAFLLRHPINRSILGMVQEAVQEAAEKKGTVLNISSSKDQSGVRESVYQSLFKDAVRYETVDFWEDRYIANGIPLANSYSLPFPDREFDVILTTKIIMEHVTEPKETMRDILRTLKPGGNAYLIFSFFRGIHQRPHDYFRFSEYAIRHLAETLGARVEYIRATNSDFVSAVDLGAQYPLAGIIVRCRMPMVKLLRSIWLPVAYSIDRFMLNPGKYPRHYVCKLHKPL